MLRNFKIYLMEEEKSDVTIEKYLRDVRTFLSWLGDRRLEKGSVLEYKASIMENYAVASVNSMFSSLNSYFDFIDRGDCKVKVIKQQRRLFCAEEKELTRAEYERLLQADKDMLYYADRFGGKQ